MAGLTRGGYEVSAEALAAAAKRPQEINTGARDVDLTSFADFPEIKIDFAAPLQGGQSVSQAFEKLSFGRPKPRNLREAIPAGQGRLSPEEYLQRVRKGQSCGMKSLLQLCGTEHSKDWRKPSVVCIVGGGPTLQDEVGALRRLVNRGAKVIAVNKSHDWLLRRGLPCHYAVLLDPKEWVAGYIDLDLARHKDTRRRAGKLWVEPTYLIASQCHDDTINKFLKHSRAYMWHAAAGLGEAELLKAEFPKKLWACIAGASVVGLRAVAIAHGFGFRDIHGFGLDGSLRRPDGTQLRQILKHLSEAGAVRWAETRQPTEDEIWEMVLTLTTGGSRLPDPVSNILKGNHYSYSKPQVDATWKSFTVSLKSGWERAYLANHHMARTAYEFEDSLKEWDKNIKDQRLEPFNIHIHGNPEHSAIAMIAAGMGIHAKLEFNEMYGRAPHAKAA